MTPELVTLFGGTGFLGRRIVKALVERGCAVRVAVRHPDAASFDVHGDGTVSVVRCDIRDGESQEAALDGAMAAINCVSLYVEKGENSFEALHVRAAENLARLAAAQGLRTLIHVSGINAGPESLSAYARARGRGDEAVRAAFPRAVVLRPSVLFGPGDRFFNLFAEIAKAAPFMPIFGDGSTLLQPVFVDDVAKAVARTIETPEHHGGLFELGGPEALSYRRLLQLAFDRVGRRPLLLPVPFFCWDLAAMLLSPLPSPPVTRDQVALMRQHNIVAPEAKGFPELGIVPKAVEEVLPSYL